jgi:hypothetical protein
MLESLIGQHGQSNVQSAMNNNMLGSLVGQLGQAIQCHPGIPQFAKDEMCQALGGAQQSCPPEPTTPGCQRDTDDAMGGLIDKIVNKVVDMIMDKLKGGGCESGGSIEDMIHQAIEDVVREKIDGGCSGDGNTAAAEPGAGNGSNCTRTEGDRSGSNWVDDFNSKEGNRVAQDSSKSQKQKEQKDGCKNWLVALAEAMAEVQNKFLSAAMKNQETMQANTPDSESKDQKAEDKKRKEFMKAQSQYSANMQMFNQTATTTATTLKTLGEALAAISRKQ